MLVVLGSLEVPSTVSGWSCPMLRARRATAAAAVTTGPAQATLLSIHNPYWYRWWVSRCRWHC